MDGFDKKQIQAMTAHLAREKHISDAGALQRLQELATAATDLKEATGADVSEEFREVCDSLLKGAAEFAELFEKIVYDEAFVPKKSRGFAAGRLSTMTVAELRDILSGETKLKFPGQ